MRYIQVKINNASYLFITLISTLLNLVRELSQAMRQLCVNYEEKIFLK